MKKGVHWLAHQVFILLTSRTTTCPRMAPPEWTGPSSHKLYQRKWPIDLLSVPWKTCSIKFLSSQMTLACVNITKTKQNKNNPKFKKSQNQKISTRIKVISLWKIQMIYENLTISTFVHDLHNDKNTNNYSSIIIKNQSEKLPMGIKVRKGNSERANHSDKSCWGQSE